MSKEMGPRLGRTFDVLSYNAKSALLWLGRISAEEHIDVAHPMRFY